MGILFKCKFKKGGGKIMAVAWLYHAGDRVYYWTESYTMSTTQFAREVSRCIGKSLSASDISVCERQADLDSKRKIALKFIYID